MLDITTKQKIDSLRNLLVGKVPDPKSQVEQITVALFYKFMWDRDKEIKDLGGNATFFVGEFEKYSWDNLFAPDLGGSDRVKLYSEAIEEMENNPNIPSIFRDIFKRAFLPYNDPYTLKLFLSDINDFHYSNSEKLGDGFEYLLSILGTQGDAGQFRTPRHIIDFITEVVNPKKGDRIVDPACGTAGFIISAYKHILKTNTKESLGDLLTPEDKKRLGNNLVGLDIDPMMVKLALANMYLHGLNEPHIYEYDSLTSEERWDDMFDVVLANPPFMTPSGGIRPHKRFAVNATKAEVLFTSYINTHLSSTGRAGIIVPEGIIFQSGNAYKELRKQLIESSLIGVISLPGGVFNPYSGVKTSILILDKALNKKTDKIFFAKVENDGFDLGSQRRKIEKNDLPRISKSVNEYCNNLRTGLVKDHSYLNYTLKDEILESGDFILNHNRYINHFTYAGELELKRIESLVNITSGFAFKSNCFNNTGDGIPIIRIRDIKTNKSKTFYKGDYDEKYIVNNGDLIIGMDGEFNCCIWQGGKALLNQRVCRLETNDGLLKKYLFRLIKKELKRIEDKTFAVTVKHISVKQIKAIEIPLPPLETQKEIAKELEQFQKVIDGAKQVVDNYKPHFEIDDSWDKIELKNIGEIKSGGTPKSDNPNYWNGNVKWITLVDLPANDSVTKINLSKRTITDSGLKNSSAVVIPKNSIIVSSRATIGRVAINLVPLATNQGFKNITDINEDQFNIDFVAYSIYTKRDYLVSIGTGGTFKEINKTNFSKVKISMPSIEIQNQIVEKIEEERKTIIGNKKLIEIYSKKIEDRINKIWGE